MTLTDKAWQNLFDRYNILQEIEKNGFYEIEAKTIKEEREPRLMAKFDHSTNLPTLFKKNGLSILPLSRSKYILGQFNAYQKLTYNEKLKPIQKHFPREITTIDPTNLYSESTALHCAVVTGMIEDVLGEEAFQTISGRMSSKQFDFSIRTRRGTDHRISISNSQIEIDGGYEGANQFMIVEAKNQTVDDFLVRQLYYPYRLWQSQTYKEVKPVFLTYSNDVFSFFVFRFTDPSRYNSIELIEQKDYIIADEDIGLEDILDVLDKTQIVSEPEIAFPQADSFPRIIDLLGLLVENDLDRETITLNYDFNERQTYYYTTAGMYLGLMERYTDTETKQVKFALSNKGRVIMNKSFKHKYLSLVGCILAHQPFKQVFVEYLQTSSLPERGRIVEIMKRCNLYNVNSEHTYKRRAQTIIKWVEWIFDLPNK